MSDKPKSHGRIAVRPSLKPRDLMDPNPEIAGRFRAKIVTLFPEAFPGPLGLSLTGKALKDGLWSMDVIELRRFGLGRHRQVDDTPAGGGPGLVLRADVVGSALAEARAGTPKDAARWPVVYPSPRGMPFTQSLAKEWAKADGITLLCGRFEGVDQRVLDQFSIQEVSLGDFVMTGGEIAAHAFLDATVRLLPGVLGNAASTEDESHSNGLLEHPQFTRPAEWEGRKIPSVLTSGDHGAVDRWRQEQKEALTKRQRPDLWAAYKATK